MFLRMAPEIETTGTFKYRKMDLVSDGYDPALTKTPTYFRNGDKGFIKVTKTVFEKLKAGGYRL
jgi:fatty-acyl-CoA synthase